MYERLLIVIVAAILGYGIYFFLHRYQLRRAQIASIMKDGIQFKLGAQHIVYFWSEGCSQCNNAQKPTLDRLMEAVNKRNVELITIRVEENSELAKSWGVRTLPTTYVIDEQGNVVHVNSGLASESILAKQLDLSTPII